MAVDPGSTTGLAWCDRDVLMGDEAVLALKIAHKEIGGDGEGEEWMTDRIMLFIHRANVRTVVMEKFVLGRQVLKGKGALSAVRIDAMLRYGLHHKWVLGVDEDGGGGGGGGGVELVYQTASEGKGVMTDTRLKSLGAWCPGEEHARDATRHLLTYGRKVRGRG